MLRSVLCRMSVSTRNGASLIPAADGLEHLVSANCPTRFWWSSYHGSVMRLLVAPVVIRRRYAELLRQGSRNKRDRISVRTERRADVGAAQAETRAPFVPFVLANRRRTKQRTVSCGVFDGAARRSWAMWEGTPCRLWSRSSNAVCLYQSLATKPLAKGL